MSEWWILMDRKILLENGYNFLDSDKAAEKASFFESIHHHHHLESQSRNGVLCWSNTGQIRHRRHSLRPCSDICTLCRPVGGERKEQIGLSSEQRQQWWWWSQLKWMTASTERHCHWPTLTRRLLSNAFQFNHILSEISRTLAACLLRWKMPSLIKLSVCNNATLVAQFL